jgi:heptosyltransferase-3
VDFCGIDDPDWLWLFGNESSSLPPAVPKYHRAYVVLTHPEKIITNLGRAGTRDCLTVSSRPPSGTHVVEHLHQGLGLELPELKPTLDHLRTREKRNIIWTHPGSGGPHKCVPLAFMARVVTCLSERLRWDVVITVGEDDAFLKGDPEWPALVGGPRTHLLERRPLLDVCRELGSSRLFVGNDSGMSHLAAGLGIPSTIFFVATDPVQWAPWAPEAQTLIVESAGKSLCAGEWAGRIVRDLVKRKKR